jgi:hypothetical protein
MSLISSSDNILYSLINVTERQSIEHKVNESALSNAAFQAATKTESLPIWVILVKLVELWRKNSMRCLFLVLQGPSSGLSDHSNQGLMGIFRIL